MLHFPTIERNQAQRQLQLLGYQQGERVYLRFFYPSDDPRKDGDKGRKADRLRWEEVEEFQRQGRGAYFVINGGGHKNDDVQVGRALFIEHDHLEKEIQRELWKTLGLPEPTFQIDTGGKSIHSYWVFTEPIPVQPWCELQKDLLELADADRSIKNPARVMRLAGAWHISIDQSGKPVYNQTRIISDSGQTYSYEELRAIIPSSAPEPPCPPASFPRHPDHIQIPVPAPVPLLECCRQEVRDWVASGVPKGSGRNDAAIEVGLELVAVERHLTSIGQPFSDSARQLFSEFCQRSGMADKEELERWSWCEQKNPTPSCHSDGVEACIRGWYWREYVRPSERNSDANGSRQFGRGRGFGGANSDKNNSNGKQANLLNLPKRIRKILNRYETESEQVSALMDLADAVGRTMRDIEHLARIVRSEGDLAEEIMEAVSGLKANLKSYRKRLELPRYLHPSLATLLVDAAAAMPTAPEYLFTTLLSASASRIGTAARIVVNPAGGYSQPMIFWSANVSHSGQAKTPPQQVIIKPLEDMEAEANSLYEKQRLEHEQDKSGELPPPSRKRFLLNNVTTAVKIRIHHQNQRGLLEYLDELVSDFTRSAIRSGETQTLGGIPGFSRVTQPGRVRT